jgi:hypothetical protein
MLTGSPRSSTRNRRLKRVDDIRAIFRSDITDRARG